MYPLRHLGTQDPYKSRRAKLVFSRESWSTSWGFFVQNNIKGMAGEERGNPGTRGEELPMGPMVIPGTWTWSCYSNQSRHIQNKVS